MSFAGFPKETFTFLESISKNNDKAWFEAHRDLYEAGYVAPARMFVEALGPKLRKISSGVQFDPKINGSIGRINRDIRFSKDKRPYKDHLDLWFWHGDKKGWDQPGFYVRLTHQSVYLGTGIHGLEGELLEAYRQSVIHPRSGKALLAAIAKAGKAGAEIGGKTRKLMPRGYEAEADRAEYLLHEGLYATVNLPGKAAAETDFVEACLEHFKATWPIGEWLLAEVSGG
ncbi:MAG: DUF2461 domain-containing protein [Devosia sp.]